MRDVFEKFDLDAQIARLDASNLLYLVLGKFVDIDLGLESVSNFGSIGAASLVTRRFGSEETAVRSNKVTLIWGILTLISLLVLLVLMLMGVVSL